MTDVNAYPIVETWHRYTAWLREHVPSAIDNLAPGATEEQFAEVASVVGHPLPEDAKALLRLNNGQLAPFLATSARGGEPAFPDTNLLSTDSIIYEWRAWREALGDDDWHDAASTLAPDAIKPYYSCRNWVPLLSAVARADYFGADFEPGVGGVPGQIINFGRDEERHYLAAPDITTLVALVADALMSGSAAATEPSAVENAWEEYRPAFEVVFYHHFPSGRPDRPALKYADWREAV